MRFYGRMVLPPRLRKKTDKDVGHSDLYQIICTECEKLRVLRYFIADLFKRLGYIRRNGKRTSRVIGPTLHRLICQVLILNYV